MPEENDVRQELIAKFNLPEESVRIQRPKRIFADVPAEVLRDILGYAAGKLDFSFLCTITGLDEVSSFAVIYHLARRSGVVLSIKIKIAKERPVLRTVTEYFPEADIYEREIADLFGITVEGLHSAKRYPLPDDWPHGQYPLRKDWKPDTTGPERQEKDA